MRPSRLLQLAEKNRVKLPYQTIEDVEQAYAFENLAEFVDLFIKTTEVVQSAEDFQVLTQDYLDLCQTENIIHTEVFCDIRTYVDRGYRIIPCFVRHLGAEIALADWQILKKYRDQYLAIGLAAVEQGYPPKLFKEVFAQVRAAGVPVVAHAGEEAGADYIWSALKDIGAVRIDHGITCLEDDALVDYLVEHNIPLTVCPQSNVKLNVCGHMSQHPLQKLLKRGLNVSIHSDDPAHFGAFLTDNLLAIQAHCGITDAQIYAMTVNAAKASFASSERKAEMLQQLTNYAP